MVVLAESEVFLDFLVCLLLLPFTTIIFSVLNRCYVFRNWIKLFRYLAYRSFNYVLYFYSWMFRFTFRPQCFFSFLMTNCTFFCFLSRENQRLFPLPLLNVKTGMREHPAALGLRILAILKRLCANGLIFLVRSVSSGTTLILLDEIVQTIRKDPKFQELKVF